MSLTTEDKEWIETRFSRSESHIAEFRTETIRNFDLVYQRLDLLTNGFVTLSPRLSGLEKAAADFGRTATSMMRDNSDLAHSCPKQILGL